MWWAPLRSTTSFLDGDYFIFLCISPSILAKHCIHTLPSSLVNIAFRPNALLYTSAHPNTTIHSPAVREQSVWSLSVADTAFPKRNLMSYTGTVKTPGSLISATLPTHTTPATEWCGPTLQTKGSNTGPS